MSLDLESLPGWRELRERVGMDPAFADAPLLGLQLTLSGEVTISLRTWSRDSQGAYIHDRPLVVTIRLAGVSELNLSHFAPSAFVDELRLLEAAVVGGSPGRLGLVWRALSRRRAPNSRLWRLARARRQLSTP